MLREVFCEPNTNDLSWGRVASTICLIAAIAWVTRFLLLTHTIPDLNGITAFILGPYTANKVTTAVQAFSSNPVNVNVAAVNQNLPRGEIKNGTLS